METLVQDLRYAIRQLYKSPGFTLTAILTLALGIGATTAMLAIVDSVLLRPLDFPHAERLISVTLSADQTHGTDLKWSTFQEFQRNLHSFDSLAAYNSLPIPIISGDENDVLMGVQVSPNILSLLGVQPHTGHGFNDNDIGKDIAVVSEPFWNKHLHSDPNAIGKPIKAGSRSLTIVGIMPA